MHVPYPPPFSDFSLKKSRALFNQGNSGHSGNDHGIRGDLEDSPLSPPISRLVISAAQATDVVQLGRGAIVGCSHGTAEDLLRLAAPILGVVCHRRVQPWFKRLCVCFRDNTAITLMHRARTHLYLQPTHVRLSGQ
jgi:hypothetical protein